MKYVLSDGIILRREWFGCLAFQSRDGYYWQFDDDAFQILCRINIPLSLIQLQKNLISNGLFISENNLRNFLNNYEKQGLVSNQNEKSKSMIFYENKNDFRKDCLVVPSNVTIYITDFCPKNCRHCATESHNRIIQNQELKFENWVKILHKLRESGIFMLIISGGEPFSLPYIQEILEIADELQFGITLLTDFDDFTEKDILKLKSLNHLVNIQTSLDGAKAETHNFLRGKGSFSKTIRRLKKFSEANLKFSTSVAVHKKNINELDEIAELAKKCGSSSIYLNAVAPYGRAKKKMQKFLLNDNDLKFVAQKCLRWTFENKVGMRNPFWRSQLCHLEDDEYNPFVGTLNAMSLGIYNFTISSKGDCYLDAKQRAEKILNLGNIINSDIVEMWNDPRLTKIRSLHSSEKFAYTQQSKIESILNF
jgi:MoaA/NifB/PqqE/SkfB family radical SAM enzyme